MLNVEISSVVCLVCGANNNMGASYSCISAVLFHSFPIWAMEWNLPVDKNVHGRRIFIELSSKVEGIYLRKSIACFYLACCRKELATSPKMCYLQRGFISV